VPRQPLMNPTRIPLEWSGSRNGLIVGSSEVYIETGLVDGVRVAVCQLRSGALLSEGAPTEDESPLGLFDVLFRPWWIFGGA